MGMFCCFEIFIDLPMEDLVDFIMQDIIEKNIIRRWHKGYDLVNDFYSGNRHDYFTVTVEGMTIFIETCNAEDNKLNLELYHMLFTYKFYIELRRSVDDVYDRLMKFLGEIMKKYPGDCIISPNGETVLIRRNSKIIVAKDCINQLSYDLLSLPYEIGAIDHDED